MSVPSLTSQVLEDNLARKECFPMARLDCMGSCWSLSQCLDLWTKPSIAFEFAIYLLFSISNSMCPELADVCLDMTDNIPDCRLMQYKRIADLSSPNLYRKDTPDGHQSFVQLQTCTDGILYVHSHWDRCTDSLSFIFDEILHCRDLIDVSSQ